jgi:hypothetical protein
MLGQLMPGADKRRAKGGARPGSGRKPKLATQLRALAIAAAGAEAEYSLGYCAQVRDSSKAKVSERLEAAKILMDRIWGRPRPSPEPISQEKSKPVSIKIETFCEECEHAKKGNVKQDEVI